jgi:molybdenum cofactor guanylyltransferase
MVPRSMSLETRPRFGTACVLAGGRGSRLEGMDKLRLEFGGERLLGRIARQLASRFTELVAVSPRPEALAGLGYTVVPDRFPGAGPLAGLHAALLASRSKWVYLVACDMPFFSAAWVDALIAGIDRAESEGVRPLAATARSGRYMEPFHALYHKNLSIPIGRFLSDDSRHSAPSIQSRVASNPSISIDGYEEIVSGMPLFFNMNTPGDIETARRIGRET